MLVMVHFQSAQYHTEMAQVTSENVGSTVLPVFMFGLLQVASFWVLAVVIKRNCGMRALYQLAFMLETQMVLVQSKLVFWVIVMLCFRIKHFGEYSQDTLHLASKLYCLLLCSYFHLAGVDFTFQFLQF